jgi:hypothetical protein
MCARLGIELVGAGSPQAKGGVERMHGTHQDRLVKKLRRKNTASHAEASACLEVDYLSERNRRFPRPATRPEDFHRWAPRAGELDKIFRLESLRAISDDWRVRYDNRFFQLQPQTRHYAKANDKGRTKKRAFRKRFDSRYGYYKEPLYIHRELSTGTEEVPKPGQKG